MQDQFMTQSTSIVTETSPLGQSICLFRPDNHALCLLNDTAAQIWQARNSGRHDDDIARHLHARYGVGITKAREDVDALVDEWGICGLLDATVPPQTHRTQVKLARPATQSSNPVLDATFGVDDISHLRIKCHEPILASLLAAVLQPMHNPSAAHQCIEIGENNDGYWFVQNGILVATALQRPQVRRLVLRQGLLHRHTETYISAILHASCVNLNGKAVVIAGASGAGKTTLTAALTQAGATYLADDLVPLNENGLLAGDFPVALAVKAGSWPSVTELYPELDKANVLTTRRLQVRYLALGDTMTTPRFMPVATLIFPKFSSGVPFKATKLSPEAAFIALLDSGSAPEGMPYSVKSIANLANTIPAWQINYGNLDEAVNWIGDNHGKPVGDTP